MVEDDGGDEFNRGALLVTGKLVSFVRGDGENAHVAVVTDEAKGGKYQVEMTSFTSSFQFR